MVGGWGVEGKECVYLSRSRERSFCIGERSGEEDGRVGVGEGKAEGGERGEWSEKGVKPMAPFLNALARIC